MNVKRALRISLFVLLALFFAISVVAEAYRLVNHSVKTQVVYEQTVMETLDTEMFVIRDETMLTHPASGVVLPLAANSERVSRGSTIAAVFPDEETAEHFAALRACSEQLEVYQKIDNQLRLADVDLEKLTAETDKKFLSLVNAAYENDFSTLSKDTLSLSEKLSRYQISLGQEVDCSAQIYALQQEIGNYTGSAEPSQIIAADISGYYVARPDGYEGLITGGDVDALTVSQLREALASDPLPAPENNIGKIIDGYRWFVACVLSSDQAAAFSKNQTVDLMLDDTQENTVSATVYSIKTDAEGNAVVIFKCTLMNAQLCSLRKLEGRIVMHAYTGLKIQKDALRFDAEGNEGVFVLRGDVVSFRSVAETYVGEDFVIASAPADAAALPYRHVQLYDEVITSGKELKDGMVL